MAKVLENLVGKEIAKAPPFSYNPEIQYFFFFKASYRPIILSYWHYFCRKKIIIIQLRGAQPLSPFGTATGVVSYERVY